MLSDYFLFACLFNSPNGGKSLVRGGQVVAGNTILDFVWNIIKNCPPAQRVEKGNSCMFLVRK